VWVADGSTGSASASAETEQDLQLYKLDVVTFLHTLLELHGSMCVSALLGLPCSFVFTAQTQEGATAVKAGATSRVNHRAALTQVKAQAAQSPHHLLLGRELRISPEECFDTSEVPPELMDLESVNRLAQLWVHYIRVLDLAPPQLEPDSCEHSASLIAQRLTKLLNGLARRMKHGQWVVLITNILETMNATLSRWGPSQGHGYYHPSLACFEDDLQYLDYLSFDFESTGGGYTVHTGAMRST